MRVWYVERITYHPEETPNTTCFVADVLLMSLKHLFIRNLASLLISTAPLPISSLVGFLRDILKKIIRRVGADFYDDLRYSRC